MKRPPTDKELLQLIYDHYYEEFGAYNEDSKRRSTKNYVPISCAAIARKLKVDEDIVFGQLYLRFQPVDATHALNLAAGVSNSKVFLGRSFSSLAIQFSSACV